MKGLHVFGSHTYHGGAEWGILHWDVGCEFHSQCFTAAASETGMTGVKQAGAQAVGP